VPPHGRTRRPAARALGARLLWGRLVEFFLGDPLYVVILSITIVDDADFQIFLQGTTLFLPLLSVSSPIFIWSSNLA
jgi:hypothetical protein